MSEHQHTPGPWTIAAGRYLLAITPAQTKQIAIFDSDDDWEEEQAANARLIAAAPELLAACIKSLPEWHAEDDGEQHNGSACGEITWGDVRAMRAAIAKATGKEPA